MPAFAALLLCLSIVILAACAPAQPAGQAASRPLKYVAIGASDTVGVGARDAEHDGWTARFYNALPPGSSLANLGVSGSLLSQAIDQQLPVALAAQPDVVTVWLAVNDLNGRVPLERYTADLDRLLTALKSSDARILVGNVP